jgi:hypothetical protein
MIIKNDNNGRMLLLPEAWDDANSRELFMERMRNAIPAVDRMYSAEVGGWIIEKGYLKLLLELIENYGLNQLGF